MPTTTVNAMLGTVTVTAVTPAFAMKDWKRTLVSAGSGAVTVTGFAASIIAPVIAATLGMVAVTAYPAEIHQARIDVLCNTGMVTVTGYDVSPHIVGVIVPATLGQVTVTGFDAVNTISTVVKATQGVVTVTGFDAVVAKTPVWASLGQVVVTGYNPAVVAPLVIGEAIGPISDTSKQYITYYQDWATHFPAEIARRWRQFLLDTFYIATPPVTVGGTANSLELTTDEEIVQITPGQSLRFTAAYTNTGGTILDVNEIGPQSVLYEGQPLKGGEIVAGGSYEVVYDGLAWGLTTSSRNVAGLAARTWLSADQELTHNTEEAIVWAADALYDDAGFFYYGGGGIESIIIPADGRYKITGMVMFRSDAVIAEFQVGVRLYINGEAVDASRSDSRLEEGADDCGVHFEYVDIFQGGDEIILYAREWNNMSENAYAQGSSHHRRASWWAIERLR